MNYEELAEKAFSSEAFRWVPGMLGLRSRERVNEDGDAPYYEHGDGFNEDRPDPRDAATVGCLLMLVREAWDDPHICSCYTAPEDDGNDWSCIIVEYDEDAMHIDCVEHIGIGETEAEAVIMALSDAGLETE